MPNREIDLGTIDPNTKGDLLYAQNQFLRVRTDTSSAVSNQVDTSARERGLHQLVVIVMARRFGTLYSPTATLTNAETAADTSIEYTSAGDPFAVNDVIVVGTFLGGLMYAASETMRVDAIDTGTNTLTVTRGHYGSTAVAHVAGDTIYKYDNTSLGATWGKVLTVTVNAAGTSTQIGAVTDLFPAQKDAGAASWDVSLNTTAGVSLTIALTGVSGTLIEWVLQKNMFFYESMFG